MKLFLFLLFFIYFDPNIVFANSLSYAFFVIDFVFLLITRKLKVSRGAIQLFLMFSLVVLSYAISGGTIQFVFVTGVSLGVYLIAYNLLNNSTAVEHLFRTIMYVGGVLAILGLIEFIMPSFSTVLNVFRTTTASVYVENGLTRVRATFINPIFLSMVLCPALFLTQFEIFTKHNRRLHLKIMLLIELFVFLMLQTTGAIVSLLVIELIYFSKSKNIPFVKIVKVIIPVLITMGGLYLLANYQNITQASLIKVFSERVYAWTGVFRIGKDYWLLGIGPGNFDKLFRFYGGEFLSKYYFTTYNTHSDYFNVFISSGIFGIIIFLRFTIKHVKIITQVFSSKYKEDSTSMNMFVLSLLVLYFIIHRSCDDFIFNFRQVVLISTIFGAHESFYVEEYRKMKKYEAKNGK